MTIAVRAGFSLVTSFIILAGFIEVVRTGPVEARGEIDAVFLGLLAVFLVPTLIYLLGVRRADTALYFGLALFLITAFGWVFVFISDEALRAVFTPLALLATTGTSIGGVIRDRA